MILLGPRSIVLRALVVIGAISLILGVGLVADGPTQSLSTDAHAADQSRRTVATDTIGRLGSSGSPAQFRLKEERDRLVLRLVDQLVYVENVFARATPGSPSQFRAHEEAESLRELLRSAAPA